MKKILGLSLVLTSILLLSCSNNKKNEPQAEMTVKTYTEDSHNAKNSIDYKGTYKGDLPCADCEKIEVELKLDDNDYKRTSVYHKNGQTTKVEEKGTYSWDQSGNTITLNGVDGSSPNKYFVAENYLMQLDMDGNRITGEMANNYILRK